MTMKKNGKTKHYKTTKCNSCGDRIYITENNVETIDGRKILYCDSCGCEILLEVILRNKK